MNEVIHFLLEASILVIGVPAIFLGGFMIGYATYKIGQKIKSFIDQAI